MPDFYTLYLVVLLLGLSHVVIWAAIVYRYRELKGARFWLAGAITPIVGGIVLSTQGNEGLFLPTVVGNAFTIGGFYLSLMGVRRFHGDRARWLLWAALLIVSVAAMAVTFRPWYGANPLYTILQSVPLLLTAAYLLDRRRRGLGAVIAACGLMLASLAHLFVASMFVQMFLGGTPPFEIIHVAAADLFILLFSATIWNFGFIILCVDSLRSELARLAAEDDLTGLPNRRTFLKRLESALADSGAPLSLLLFDLDHFKLINDSHGHAAGDAALSHVAKTFRRLIGENVTFARLGGDEFGIVLPGARAGKAVAIAAQLGDILRDDPMEWRDDVLALTLSIGVAHKASGNHVDVNGFVELADRALYESKRKGKDTYTLLDAPLFPGKAGNLDGNVIALRKWRASRRTGK